MSLDYQDKEIDTEHANNRARFFDLIAHIEDLLEDARIYGKSASSKLFITIDRFIESESEIEKLAKISGESMPPKNYFDEMSKIATQYLPVVVHRESQKIKDAIHNLGCLNDGCKRLIDDLSKSVLYYGEMYPNLNLSKYIDEIDSICQKVPRVTRKNFWQRFFGN
ncbi:MAG: hypothetical protein KBC17_00820 [Candidatus Pacebacteria bacterium]|nr:hypothetical protein [Candidatus Paceibacterota bacterium]